MISLEQIKSPSSLSELRDVEQCVCTVTLDSTRYLERKWSREEVKLSRAESKEGRKEAKSVV